MDWRNSYHQNYLASLLSSTAPLPPTRQPSHATENHSQGGIYSNPPSPNPHRHPIYSRPRTMTSYPIPRNQTAQYMQMHPSQAPYYQAAHPVAYQGHPFITAPISQHEVRPPSIPIHSGPAVPGTQNRLTHKTPTPEMDSPTRRVIEELEAEEELDHKTVRSSLRARKPRKLTPVLVFDNDSDDGDYEERTRGKKRKNVQYDSEGAIDAEGADETDSARSTTEEMMEPTEPEEPEEPQPKRQRQVEMFACNKMLT